MTFDDRTEKNAREVIRKRAEELLQFLDMVSDKARELDCGVYSKFKHIRHEARWAYYGVEHFFEGNDSTSIDTDDLQEFLHDYFSEKDPDSSAQRLVSLIGNALKQDRIPSEKEVCEAYRMKPYLFC